MKTEINDILDKLLKEETTWLNMANEITSSSKINSQDLLHDFYVAIHKKVEEGKVKIKEIMYNDSINKSFVYKMMHNIFIDTIRKDKDVYYEKELMNSFKADNSPYIDKDKLIDQIVDEFYWFDKKLFNLYRKKFHSIRKLSKATNISHVVVWRTINNCIKEIKKKINEK